MAGNTLDFTALSNVELAARLVQWAEERERCNEKPQRAGKGLDSRLLYAAAERLLDSELAASMTIPPHCPDCQQAAARATRFDDAFWQCGRCGLLFTARGRRADISPVSRANHA